MGLFGGDSVSLSTSNTQNTDQSQAFSAGGGSGNVAGAALTLGSANGATINVSDPNAIAMARELGLSSLATAQSAVASQSATTDKALGFLSDLKKTTLVGEGQQVGDILFKVVAVGAAVWLGAKLFAPKSKSKEASK